MAENSARREQDLFVMKTLLSRQIMNGRFCSRGAITTMCS